MKKRPDLYWFAESVLKGQKGRILHDKAGFPLFDANRRELLDRANDLEDQVYGRTFILVPYERVELK